MRTALALALLLIASTAASAIPIGDTMQMTESLTAVVIHNGPTCSSGWHQVDGACVSDDTAPLILLAEPAVPVTTYQEAQGEDTLVTPEPATLLLLGGTLAAAGWLRRYRR